MAQRALGGMHETYIALDEELRHLHLSQHALFDAHLCAVDTPMITLMEAAIPGLGTYSARVIFYRSQYAGIWSAGDHGGQMFERIERTPAQQPQAPEKK